MADKFYNFFKLGNGKLTDINKAKFLLSKSFTIEDLFRTFKMSDEVLSFVLAQSILEDKANLN
jgi:hypothetical protein